MESKEDRIVAAAFQLFYRHGYRKVSMSDIAEAAQMSRPSLYAAFANKEAIFAELVKRQRDKDLEETAHVLPTLDGLEARLTALLDIWIIQPISTVIDSENGTELLANCASYAPEAIEDLYTHFEAQLVAVIAPCLPANAALPAADLAHILRMATTSIKASASNLPEVKRMAAGMVKLALASARA